MRFKTFTVSQADFDSWVANQQQMSAGSAAPAPAAAAPAPGAPTAAANAAGAGVPAAGAQPAMQVTQAGFIAFPREKLPAHVIPQTPLPTNLAFDDNLLPAGNAANGAKLVSTGMCIACHTIRGVPTMLGNIGPNLTHVGSRTTIGAGLYPNDPRHLARWVKNAPAMKPGIAMPALGTGEYDPVNLKGPVKVGGYSDQQIADIVAYLSSLK
jgi:cytochrome c oxidase subunit 2